MLFAIKNRLLPTLLLLSAFVAISFYLRCALGLVWATDFSPTFLRYLAWGACLVVVSDGGIHGLLILIFGASYRAKFRALVAYFAPQRWPEIIAGGLLAGGEELIFRGVLLEGLRSVAGIPVFAAVGIAAVAFGVMHTLGRRDLLPFAVWAVWEGALLGWIYVWSGSILVVVILHTAHDLAGFTAFAWERRQK